jgi:excisionase family DNA binding protein
MAPQPRRYLTARQVADLLGVHRSTVSRWADEHASMPALRIGSTVRFEVSALEKWLAAHTQRSRRSAPDRQTVVQPSNIQ